MESDNNNNNSLQNELIQKSNLYQHKNFQNQTQKKNFTFMKNKKTEEPIYVMTVELEKGKNESIKIFPSSKPEELAYEFCKNHNLDFSSLSYLTEEISNLFKKFPNEKKDKILENEPIEEVDEDEYIHGIEKKISNNNINQKLNNDNFVNNIINNNNINDNQNLNNMDLYSSNKLNDEKIDFSGTKGRIDSIDEFNDFEKDIIKDDEKGDSINLDLELEKDNENNNINNNYINNDNKKFNINNDNKNYINNKVNNEINNNYIINNDNNKKIFKDKKKDKDKNKEKEQKDNINKKNKINENFDFYYSRQKVISYEQFYDNFKKNLVTHPNFFKKKQHLKNKNKLNKDYKSFNLDIKRMTQNCSNISKTDYNIINPNNNNNLFVKTFSENSSNIKDKFKEEINKSKKMNKSLFIKNHKDIFMNHKNNLENFFSTCAALDEVYQNRINDESIFISKLNSPNQINLNKKKLSVKDFSENENNSSKINFKKSLSSNHQKSNNKVLFSNISKSERNNNAILKHRKSKYKFENDNYKNISFSPSINSSGLNQKSKLLFSEKEMIISPNKDIKFKKRNSYILLKNISFSPNKKTKDKKGYFYNKRKIINNNDNNINNSDKIDNYDKENLLKKIFLLLDPENKGYADLKSSNTQKIPIQVIIILSPIFNNSKNKNKIPMNEFISNGNVLLNKLPFEDKRTLFEFSSKI